MIYRRHNKEQWNVGFDTIAAPRQLFLATGPRRCTCHGRLSWFHLDHKPRPCLSEGGPIVARWRSCATQPVTYHICRRARFVCTGKGGNEIRLVVPGSQCLSLQFQLLLPHLFMKSGVLWLPVITCNRRRDQRQTPRRSSILSCVCRCVPVFACSPAINSV